MKTSAGVNRLGVSIPVAIAVLVWCLFMGVTAISIGVGAIFPSINLVAKPFVCPNGNMVFTQTTSQPSVGSTITTTHWSCVDSQAETTTPLDIFPMGLYAGLIYGFLLFVVVAGLWLFRRRGQAATQAQRPAAGQRRNSAAGGAARQNSRAPHPALAQAHVAARMQELKQLREANLISEDEYQQKRQEILRDV